VLTSISLSFFFFPYEGVPRNMDNYFKGSSKENSLRNTPLNDHKWSFCFLILNKAYDPVLYEKP
jgi:hypothetical protein